MKKSKVRRAQVKNLWSLRKLGKAFDDIFKNQRKIYKKTNKSVL
jgi:hypothetical protein